MLVYFRSHRQGFPNKILHMPLNIVFGLAIASIVLPRSNDYVYICLFINIEIRTLGWHIQHSGIVFEIYLSSACIAQ